MIDFERQLELLKSIGIESHRRIEALVIGGSAMMFLGAKTVTKDIDLVLLYDHDFLLIKRILKKMNFKERKLKIIRGNYKPRINPTFLEIPDVRVDLFFKEVVCIKITDTILSRIKEVHQFDNLIIKVLSPEDLILMKCTTEREGDRNDAQSLIEKFKIDWNIIIEESLKQTKIGGIVFPVFLYDFLLELKEDLKVDIPKDVILKIMKIAENEIIRASKEGKLIKEEKY